MSSIDPIRRPAPARKPKRAGGRKRQTEAVQAANLPALIEPAAEPLPPEPAVEAHTVFAAQLLGQDGGEKRGLRAGPQFIETANASYNRAEWSGSKDRRGRQGRIAKTEV
jgi:hypothetical protein